MHVAHAGAAHLPAMGMMGMAPRSARPPEPPAAANHGHAYGAYMAAQMLASAAQLPGQAYQQTGGSQGVRRPLPPQPPPSPQQQQQQLLQGNGGYGGLQYPPHYAQHPGGYQPPQQAKHFNQRYMPY